ncbi:hypothetical protein ACFP1Z_14830 [Streptomyces gamaensis]|uniref:Uncharacterized protein n=1 Tax=Streptomyces gamaensis TaxID=1763542 RepID=A0ABW0Z1S5_9ACTN
MTSSHTHLTPDLPPIVEVPDLPGAQPPRRSRKGEDASGTDGPEDGPASAQGRGAHQENDGRHGRAGEDSGG